MFVIAAAWMLASWDLGGEVCPGDLARFPADHALAAEYWSIADWHHQWVESHARHVPWIDGHEWSCKTRRATHAWMYLAEAWRFYAAADWHANQLHFINGQLRQLYDVIGPENYRAGLMPDPIPYRRVMP